MFGNLGLKAALTAILLALSVATAYAQQPGRVYRIGYLSPRLGIEAREEAFRQALAAQGLVDGKNLAIEWRFAKGNIPLFPQLAAELVRSNVDCVLAVGVNAIENLRKLTQTIPIVMGTIDVDPVKRGLVASLARPGGNVTGFTGIAHDIAGKRLELLKEIVPQGAFFGILVDPSPAADAHIQETELAARALKLKLQVLEARAPEALDGVFRGAREKRLDGLSVVGTGLMNSHRTKIAELAVSTRMPLIFSQGDFVLDGGLASYATDLSDQFRRAGEYVARILKGTKPADLPVQQPTKFEFIVNLKAAQRINLTLPPQVLAKADRVIR